MAVLTPQQRNTLEAAVKQARKVAEQGAFNALQTMAVNHPMPFKHMDVTERSLRNSLRSKARLLGDASQANGVQDINHLSYELAYETWHKMLFAKFLEANHLLMHPDGVAVTMDDCDQLAHEEGYADKWDAAANYASRMLPAIFRVDDPLMKVGYASNDRIKLEGILERLENAIFIADDALGWVYQFWQSEAKAAINASGDKIDGEKLPAVTQLFTEPYMVHFLIDNTLGAWWVSRNPGVKPPVKFEYLRVVPASSRNENNDSSNLRQDDNIYLRQDDGATFFNPYEEIEYVKGNLPHWRQEGKIYFVTFRTADSMPQEKLKEWQEELDAWKAKNPEPHSAEQCKEYNKRFPAKMQEYLDAGYGACQLKNQNIKSIVENALKFFDGDRYVLDEYVVAANHVHVLVQPKGDYQLSDILHSWKSYTANEINKVTGETGAFWQKESFDHLVRSEASLEKFRDYIGNHGASGFKVAPSSSRSNRDDLRQNGGNTIPAAGTFEGWPNKTAEITALDPCMGSGHFVASLFPVFAALRMHEEGLSKEEATDKVIAENLHGLELDPRCTQIAAFNLALTAWKFCGHYKELPEMNLACSGIAPKGKVDDWVKLVGKVERADDKARMENGMRMLYQHFQLAPELGSLLDPTTIKADAFTASFEELQPVLKKALENEADTEQLERGVMAAGIAKAGQLLAKKYSLVITNVPFLTRNSQDEFLYNWAGKHYPNSKYDLGTMIIERSLTMLFKHGCISIVSPQHWHFFKRYQSFRKKTLSNFCFGLTARLGSGAFETISGEVVNVMLFNIFKSDNKENSFYVINLSNKGNASEKALMLHDEVLTTLIQREMFSNPELRIVDKSEVQGRVEDFGNCWQGIACSDTNRFVRFLWEIPNLGNGWILQQSNIKASSFYGGCDQILFWEDGYGQITEVAQKGATFRGMSAWGKKGVSIGQFVSLQCALYLGGKFDGNAHVLTPFDENDLPAIWLFSTSEFFRSEIKKMTKSMAIKNNVINKVPIDIDYWRELATESYPNGLPKPYSDDPTQWLFHGHLIKTENPLQVAIARVLGYRWPAENDAAMELAEEARELNAAVKAFDHLSDEDGIFCIPSVNAEQAGAERFRDFLQEVFASEWNNQTITQLLQKEGAKSANLETWLRDEFFVQHCKVFQNHPFIWHIWDGRKDGFSVLVNYHKLTNDNLSKLIYTYLGDWIRMCEAKKKAGESGAEGLLSAAQKLKEKLEAILEGEAPYDIFVRWKPLEQQPIGWDPDLNDGVRLNIRPFMEADVLRKKPNIKWGIDRGKNPPGSPWGEVRDNDKHLSLEEKRLAREKMKT